MLGVYAQSADRQGDRLEGRLVSILKKYAFSGLCQEGLLFPLAQEIGMFQNQRDGIRVCVRGLNLVRAIRRPHQTSGPEAISQALDHW